MCKRLAERVTAAGEGQAGAVWTADSGSDPVTFLGCRRATRRIPPRRF